jgi:DNA (cytosine-5)-methyltransferase 1
VKVLDLFSGIGGFSLGLERTGGFRTVAFCDNSPKCRHLLNHHWPEVPAYDDVCTLTAERLAADGVGPIDAICGGFPCQDISEAGEGAGLAGKRSGLWREFARLIREIRPEFVLVENVSALLTRGLHVVLGDLAAVGYDAVWHCIQAADVGAEHIRDRVWIVGFLPNAAGERLVQCWGQQFAPDGEAERQVRQRFDQPEPVRVAHGVPARVDRLHGLGNAVVPEIPYRLGRAILAARAQSSATPRPPNEPQGAEG